MVGSLPKNSQGFFTSVIKVDEIELCVRFFVLKAKNDIKIKHATQKKKALLVENIEKEHKKEVF